MNNRVGQYLQIIWCGLLLLATPLNAQIIVNGRLADWEMIPALEVPPRDAGNDSPLGRVTSIRAAHDPTFLFILVEFEAPRPFVDKNNPLKLAEGIWDDFSYIELDVNEDGRWDYRTQCSTGKRAGLNNLAVLEADEQGRPKGRYLYPEGHKNYFPLGPRSFFTAGADAIETRLPRLALSLDQGERIGIRAHLRYRDTVHGSGKWVTEYFPADESWIPFTFGPNLQQGQGAILTPGGVSIPPASIAETADYADPNFDELTDQDVDMSSRRPYNVPSMRDKSDLFKLRGMAEQSQRNQRTQGRYLDDDSNILPGGPPIQPLPGKLNESVPPPVMEADAKRPEAIVLPPPNPQPAAQLPPTVPNAPPEPAAAAEQAETQAPSDGMSPATAAAMQEAMREAQAEAQKRTPAGGTTVDIAPWSQNGAKTPVATATPQPAAPPPLTAAITPAAAEPMAPSLAPIIATPEPLQPVVPAATPESTASPTPVPTPPAQPMIAAKGLSGSGEAPRQNEPIQIDGQFEDWLNAAFINKIEARAQSRASHPIGVLNQMAVAYSDNYLYTRLDFAQPRVNPGLDVQGVVDSGAILRLDVDFDGEWDYEIQLAGEGVQLVNTAGEILLTGDRSGAQAAGLTAALAADGKTIEVQIPRAALGLAKAPKVRMQALMRYRTDGPVWRQIAYPSATSWFACALPQR